MGFGARFAFPREELRSRTVRGVAINAGFLVLAVPGLAVAGVRGFVAGRVAYRLEGALVRELVRSMRPGRGEPVGGPAQQPG